MRKNLTITVAAAALIAGLLASLALYAAENAPASQGSMMQPGQMMGGQMLAGQMMGGQMQPGMMQGGQGGMGMMGGQMQPRQMKGGQMQPGMMNKMNMMGQGMMGHDFGARVVPSKHLSVEDVRHFLEHRLARRGNKRLKVGEVKEEDDAIIADIVTVDDSLVERLRVDRHTGRIEHVD